MGKVSKALKKHGGQVTPQTGAHETVTPQESPAAPVEERLPENIAGDTAESADGELRTSPSATPYPRHWDERLTKATEKYSLISESIRKLRTLILSPVNENEIHSILIISSSAREGKSFICSNLAINIAQSMEKQALMVDCDLRRPNLQNLFGLHHEKGLADYLLGTEELHNIIYQTGFDKLSIIPAGPVPSNPSELISSQKMPALLEELTQRYDNRITILDSPPFHAASETQLLAAYADKVILVVRWGKSGREEVKKMAEQIGKDKILGVVFNAVEMNFLDKRVQGFGYHNYYTDQYY